MSKTENTQKQKFALNPFELLITVGLAGVFSHSIYRLAYQSTSAHQSALVPMKATPISEGRKISSIHSSLFSFELDCTQPSEQATKATRARIKGQLCGYNNPNGDTRLSSATITNQANHFSATIFAQTDSSQFSTDYIPLSAGHNPIHIEFTYSGGGSPFSQINLINRD
jgi:hypothetical protein